MLRCFHTKVLHKVSFLKAMHSLSRHSPVSSCSFLRRKGSQMHVVDCEGKFVTSSSLKFSAKLQSKLQSALCSLFCFLETSYFIFFATTGSVKKDSPNGF